MRLYALYFPLCVCYSQNSQSVKCLEVCLCVAIVDESVCLGQINIGNFCAIHSINNKENILLQINNKICHLFAYGRISVFRMVRWMSTTLKCFWPTLCVCRLFTWILTILSYPFNCRPFEWQRAYYKMKFYSKWTIVRPEQKHVEWMTIVFLLLLSNVYSRR